MNGLTGTGKSGSLTDVNEVGEEIHASPVRRARRARGLTQEQFAEEIGCSQATVFDIESGRSKPSLRLALAIAEFFGATVEDLFGGAA